MPTDFNLALRCLFRSLLFCVLVTSPLAQAQDAASLKARHAGLRDALSNNAFQRPLFLESKVSTGDLKGDIHARIDQPFAVAGPALQGYLATFERDKVGFSVVGRHASGEPIYIGSTRGLIERNTMRYDLAIEAYLGALSLPESQQLAKRLNDWHSGVERYPRQLHQLERAEYLELKRVEVQPQKAAGG